MPCIIIVELFNAKFLLYFEEVIDNWHFWILEFEEIAEETGYDAVRRKFCKWLFPWTSGWSEDMWTATV